MKRLLMMFAGLVFITSVQAVSFDCAKAGTKVEKLICNDAELSKLDDELSVAYKTAQQDEKQAAAIKQAQKQWVKERNVCSDTVCVQRAYKKRVGQLRMAQNAAAQVQLLTTLRQAEQDQWANVNDSEVVKKYPPYPDVWEWQTPIAGKYKHNGIRSAWLQNGDIRFGYVSPDKAESRIIQTIRSTELNWVTFFGGQKAVIVDEANEEARLDDGAIIKPIWKARSKNYFPGTAELKDGSYIISSQNTYWRGCYQGPAANKVTRYQSKSLKKLIQPSKVVFLLLDEPITIMTGSVDNSNRAAACEAAEKEVTARVVSIGGEILPLEDGGFLMIDENYGWVFRFDANFNTKSKLLSKKLFVFEADILDAYYINKVTGKTYQNERGFTKVQQIIDDLYAYLININKGEQ